MPNLADCAVFKQYLDNVKAEFHLGVPQQPQVVEGGVGKSATALGIDGGRGSNPVLGGPSFYFDECETIKVAENEVDFLPVAF
jgi:hypothetical protein